MLVLLLELLLIAASITGVVFGGITLDKGGNPVLLVISIIVLCGIKGNLTLVDGMFMVIS